MLRTSFALAALALLAGCNDNDLPGGSCGSCAEIYTNGGIVCGPGPSSDAWQDLDACACGTGVCGPMCTGMGNLCAAAPANQACSTCIATKCAAQIQACAAN